MKLSLVKDSLPKIKTDLLAVGLFNSDEALTGPAKAIDQALNGVLSHFLNEEQFKANEGEIFAIHTHGHLSAKKVAVVGLGERENFSLETMRKATGSLILFAQKSAAKSVAFILPTPQAAQAVAEAAILASYKFEKYKSKNEKENPRTQIEEFAIVERARDKGQEIELAIKLGEIFAHATSFARDLVNEPPAALTPKTLAATAYDLKTESSSYIINVEVFDKSQLANMGAGGILGIARGSAEEPYLIHLFYKPNGKLKSENWKLPRVALVGKGVTFDSGGLSLKGEHHMYDMKFDMAGAAVVLGVFSVLGRLKPNLEIHGIIPAVENLPSGTSIKPGDIVRSLSGKTIEVVNTDAEGRVILADALEYAKRQQPHAIIDLATLTGAVMVALGERMAGLMGNDQKLIDNIREAAGSAGERVWPLPLLDGYEDEIKSDVADVTNTHKTRYGGAMLGGLFLKEFIDSPAGEKIPWAHLDIAGPVYSAKPWAPYHPKGATGFGVRTILNYILSQ